MNRRAFTLPELLAAVAVILFLLLLAVPAYRWALAAAQSATCRSNLRQLAAAALGYARDHGGEFPWAIDPSGNPWDFARSPQTGRIVPGPLWDYTADGAARVLQCPAISAQLANWRGDPATGYNYNSSFIGKVYGEAGARTRPANAAVLSHPARTALFGDGQYSGGANKFMRAPLRDPAHDASGAAIRRAGTQGFRHNRKTNVAFADGHVESLSTPYTPGSDRPAFVTPPCAVLAPDNTLYAP